MKRFYTCGFFDQNPGCKGSISPSTFDGKMPNILFTCLCICVRVLMVINVTKYQSARELILLPYLMGL